MLYSRFYDVSECVKIPNSMNIARGSPRGSPNTRLISSLAMLVLAIGGVWFYSIRRSNELLDIGVNAHVQCFRSSSDLRGSLVSRINLSRIPT